MFIGLFFKTGRVAGRYQAMFYLCLCTLGLIGFFIPASFCFMFAELCEEYPYLIHLDKVFHFLIFATITYVVTLNARESRLIALSILLIVFGIFVEGAQHFIPSRSAGIDDVIANTLGVLTPTIMRYKINSTRQDKIL